MDPFSDSLLVLCAAPAVLALILVEIVVGHLHGRDAYSVRGTLTTGCLAAANVGLDVLTRATWLGAMDAAARLAPARIADPWAYWAALLVLQDLLFYWMHRAEHVCRVLWAVHATHHSSPEFNLTVGFRPSVLQPLYRFAWFLPLPALGFRPADVVLMYSATQLYGVLLHTRAVGRLGPLEWVLCTPSHHRVHHGTNPQYLDRNMGMVLIIWDRLFGTFAAEAEEVRYGLNGRPPTHNPVRLLAAEWAALWADLRRPAPAWARLMYVFGPSGWRYAPRGGDATASRPPAGRPP